MTDPEQLVPCTTSGCESVKFFPGRCNACQHEAEKDLPPLADPYAEMTWVEESMAKVGARLTGGSR